MADEDPTPIAVVDEKPEQAPVPETPPPAPDDGRDAAMARERRAREDADKRAKAAEDALAERERKEAEEQGRWQQIADEEKTKRQQLEAEGRAAEQRRHAERAAGDLKFKDPGYALYLLEQDKVDFADASAVQYGLRGLAESRKELVAGGPPPPSGGPAGGANDEPPGLTKAQIEAMSPRQLAALDPEMIKKALGQT